MRNFALSFAFGVMSTVILLVFSGCGDLGTLGSTKYDPEPYRAQIQQIESLVQKSYYTQGDGGRLHKYSADLAGAIRQDIPDYKVRERVMNRILNFGNHFADKEEQGAPVDLVEARAAWMTLRSDLFMHADWFQ